MRRIFLVVGCVSACGLFPSLGDLEGSDAQVADTGADAIAPQDSASDTGADAYVCGFPVGPADALVAYYPFDEGQGTTVHDCTTHALDGTFARTDANMWVAGKHGGAIRLSNPQACIDLGNPLLLRFGTAITVSVWVLVATYPVGSDLGYIIGKGQTVSNLGYRFSIEPGTLLGVKLSTAGDAGAYGLTGAGPAAGAWHHVAWVYDAGTTSLYVDGVVTGSSTSAPSKISDDPASDIAVGCHPGSTELYPFQGTMDEMRIYSRALTTTEIASLAQ